MYPTKVRSLGFGWTSAMGTVGSTLAPYIIYGSKSLNINSWIAPGVIGILGFISIFKLKETFKKPSYDDI
jgi:OCT family organic cation transporter-like MFS transporter 4/5